MAVYRPDWGTGTDMVPAQSNLPAPANYPDESNYDDQGYLPAPSNTTSTSLMGNILGSLPTSLVDSWERDGAGVGHRLLMAQAGVVAILETLRAEDQEELVALFEYLPEAAQVAIFAELSLGSAGSVRPATDEDIAEYEGTDAGALAVASWGNQAARNVARVEARARRMLNSMPQDHANYLLDWIWGIDSILGAAVLRALAK